MAGSLFIQIMIKIKMNNVINTVMTPCMMISKRFIKAKELLTKQLHKFVENLRWDMFQVYLDDNDVYVNKKLEDNQFLLDCNIFHN